MPIARTHGKPPPGPGTAAPRGDGRRRTGAPGWPLLLFLSWISASAVQADAEVKQPGAPGASSPDSDGQTAAGVACDRCHPGYLTRWRRSIMSTDADAIERNLCGPARTQRGVRGDGAGRFGREPVADEDGPEPAAGSPLYRRLIESSLAREPGRYAQRLQGISAAPACAPCHRKAAAQDPRPGCSVCHVGHSPVGDGQSASSGQTPAPTPPDGPGPTNLLDRPSDRGSAVPLERCFQCHFDPRPIARNPIGDTAVHGGDPSPTPTAALLCQDCHTSIEMHGDGNIPAHASAQSEIRCEDCHGTDDQLPWELPLRPPDRAEGRGPAAPPRGVADAHGAISATAAPNEPGRLLTSRGNPFGNVLRNDGGVYLRAVSGRDHPVTLLAHPTGSLSRLTGNPRQIHTAPGRHRAMECMECHADWLPPCVGCHAEAGASPAVNQAALPESDAGRRPSRRD